MSFRISVDTWPFCVGVASLLQLLSDVTTEMAVQLCRAALEVTVSGVSPREEVRVSGNVGELGSWDLDNSVPLARKQA